MTKVKRIDKLLKARRKVNYIFSKLPNDNEKTDKDWCLITHAKEINRVCAQEMRRIHGVGLFKQVGHAAQCYYRQKYK